MHLCQVRKMPYLVQKPLCYLLKPVWVRALDRSLHGLGH